jgi:hypothetical protein
MRPEWEFYTKHCKLTENEIISFSFMAKPKVDGILKDNLPGSDFLKEKFPWIQKLLTCKPWHGR